MLIQTNMCAEGADPVPQEVEDESTSAINVSLESALRYEALRQQSVEPEALNRRATRKTVCLDEVHTRATVQGLPVVRGPGVRGR